MSGDDGFEIPAPEFPAELRERVDAYVKRSGLPWEEVAMLGFQEDAELGFDRGQGHLYACWEAVRRDPGNGMRLLDLGHCHVDVLGDLDRAEAIYEEIDRLGRPGLIGGILDEDPLFYLGWLYWLRGRDEEAIEAYKQCLERLEDRDPGVERDREGFALAHFHLGAIYHDAESWREADEHYSKALAELEDDQTEERATIEAERERARRRDSFEGDLGRTIVPLDEELDSDEEP